MSLSNITGSFNWPQSTSSFLGSTDSLPNDLYAGTDFNTLNWFEKQWVDWYIWWGNPVIATGVMSFLLHEIFYFGRCIPWMIIDQIDYFKKWKLQDQKQATFADQWKAIKYVLLTHFTVELPQIWSFHPVCEYFGMSTHQVPFPAFSTIAYQVLVFLLFEDFFHFVAHQLLHHRSIYKYVHKIHHEYSAPFGLAAEYAHPIEILVLGAGTIGGPFLFAVATQGNLHIITVYVFVILRLFQAVDSHSGYDFPWSLRHFIPFWAGAEHHDFHHQNFLGCYATSFRHWDYIFGTDKAYRIFREKQRAEKKKAEEAKKLGAKAE